MRVEKRRGGVEVSVTPALGWKTGLDNDYLYSEDTIWQLDRAESARMRPALEALCGKSLFFTTGDATAFCSYVLPELGSRVTIEDPERLLLNQIPLEPVVQFYLDADRGLTVTAYPVFLYGEDRVAPGEPVPPDLLRDARTENRAKRLLETYLEPESGKPGHYSLSGEEALFQLLEEGIPALLAMGEVYQTDASATCRPPRLRSRWGCRCTAACWIWRWTPALPGGGAAGTFAVPAPEKTLPPPAGRQSAAAG